jgi:hypothetical protein
MGAPKTTTCKVLQKCLQLKPYRYQVLQAITDEGKVKQKTLCGHVGKA